MPYTPPRISTLNFNQLPRYKHDISEVTEPLSWYEDTDRKTSKRIMIGLAVLSMVTVLMVVPVWYFGNLYTAGMLGGIMFSIIIFVGAIFIVVSLTSPTAIAVSPTALYYRFGKSKVDIFKWIEVRNVVTILVKVKISAKSARLVDRDINFIATSDGTHWAYYLESEPPKEFFEIARKGFEDYFRKTYRAEPPPGKVPAPGTPIVKS
jgi:hypothetical protein